MSDLIESPCGCLLTPEQARTVAARLTNAERRTRSGGRKPSCNCGACPKCKAREAKRRSRAKEGK